MAIWGAAGGPNRAAASHDILHFGAPFLAGKDEPVFNAVGTAAVNLRVHKFEQGSFRFGHRKGLEISKSLSKKHLRSQKRASSQNLWVKIGVLAMLRLDFLRHGSGVQCWFRPGDEALLRAPHPLGLATEGNRGTGMEATLWGSDLSRPCGWKNTGKTVWNQDSC